MQPRALPFSRIRLPRAALHCIAYAEPTYPPEARPDGIEGAVVLDAVIGKDGEILSLSVHEGHPILAESALETVRHWVYDPIKVNGIAVEVQTQIEVAFTLHEPRA